MLVGMVDRDRRVRAGGARRSSPSRGGPSARSTRAVVRVTERQVADRDAVLTAALQQVDVLNRSQMDAATRQVQAEVAARHQVIDSSLDEVRTEIRTDLDRLGELVAKMGESSAQRFGQVDASLRRTPRWRHGSPTRPPRCARRWPTPRPAASGASGWPRTCCAWPASPSTSTTASRHRRVAGGGGGRPDFTFDLPKGHVLYMDVKFPLASYLRYLEADTDEARPSTSRVPARRARPGQGAGQARVRARERPSRRSTTCCCSCPTSSSPGSSTSTIPALLDDALGQRVVMCSPLTLFAFLGVIRQAFDNFMVEQTSDEILALVGAFNQQWRKLRRVDREGGPPPRPACRPSSTS